MKASKRGLIFVFGVLCLLGVATPPVLGQMVPSSPQPTEHAMDPTAGESGRTAMDNGHLKILFVRPWTYLTREESTSGQQFFLLSYMVEEGFQLDAGQSVVLLGSSDDQIDATKLKIADVIPAPENPPQTLDPGIYSLTVDADQMSLMQGWGRGNLVLALVVVDADGTPVAVEDSKRLLGDMTSICTGYDRNPEDLRIIDPRDAQRGDLEEVDDAKLDTAYLVDADKTLERDPAAISAPPQTEVPPLTWQAQNQCQGEMATLRDAWINEVRLQENDQGNGPTTDLRCSVHRVAFDIWYVEDPNLNDPEQLAGVVDSAKIEDATATFTEQLGTRFFRLYTSPLTTKDDDTLSSLDPRTNYPNERGELGDSVYGVWGYWGSGPLSKNYLYNMVARIEREGRVRLEKRYAEGAMPAEGGRLFLYVYDPSWYGLRWVTDTTQWKGHWVRVEGFEPRVQDGHIAYDTNLGNNVLLLDGSPRVPGYDLAVTGPDSAPWYDPDEGTNVPAPAPATAGAPITIEVDAVQLGNCPDAIAAVVTYSDTDNDVDVSGELLGKDHHTSTEARLEILDSQQDQSDPKYRGVRKLTADELDSNVSFRVMLPSSVRDEGTIKVLLVPWQQVEDGKLVAGGSDLYEMTAQVRSALRIFAERDRELNVAGVADVGFHHTPESFPWPDPFFQKNNKQYVHKDVQLFNAGTSAATLSLQVLLVKDSATADVCTSEVSPEWGRVLAQESISLNGSAAATRDVTYSLTDLHPDETRVVIRILHTGSGQNMKLHCVEHHLVRPLPRHALETSYSVFGTADDGFNLTLKTSRGGPGFTASLELTNEETGQPDGDLTLSQESVTVPDTTSSSDTEAAVLPLAIGKNIDPLASHRYRLVVTSTDLYAEKYTVEVPIAVNIVKAAPDLANVTEMTVLPVAAAVPGVGNPWRTAAWFFNQEDQTRTYEVGYVLSRDTSTNNGGGNLYTSKVPGRAMTVWRRITLAAKGRPDSLKQYNDAIDQLFGIITRTKGWIYVKPVESAGEKAQAPWPSKYPMVAEEIYSVAETAAGQGNSTPTRLIRGQFVVAQPLTWLAETPNPVHAPLVIPPALGGQSIPTRVNLHVAVLGDEPAHFQIVSFDAQGQAHTVADDLEVKADSVKYLSLDRHLRPARLEIRPLGSEGVRYAVVVSQVDDNSDDPISFQGSAGGVLAPGGDRVVVPVIARTSGRNGSRWYTDLVLANTGDRDATYSFRFFPEGGASELPETPMTPAALPAHTSRVLHDVVHELDPGVDNTKGLLLVDLQGAGKTDVLVTSRTYTKATCEAGGREVPCTYGQRVPGYAATPEILKAGEDAGVIFALDLGDGGMRENLGLANVGDDPATAVLRLMDHTGQPLKLKGADGTLMPSVAVTVDLDAHTLHQQSLDSMHCAEERAPCIASFFQGKLAPASQQVDDNGESLLKGCVLEVAASEGEITAYLTKTDNSSNDSLFIPVVQPQGYGTSLPDSDRSELHIATDSSTVGKWEQVDVVLRDSNGRPLPGYAVTLASSRPFYFRFKGNDDGEEYPRWKITDAHGKATFEVTSHAPGVSEYHLQWAHRASINAGENAELHPVDLTTKDSCEWEVTDIASQVADQSVVGRPETLTVTMKEADGSPVWPDLTVELASDRPEDTPSDGDHMEALTGEDGVATFTVGTTTIGLSNWHAILHDQVDHDTVGGESGTTIDDQTLWSLDETASSVIVGDPSPAAGPTDGTDCNGDGIVDAGDTLTVTATLMGENGQPVTNAKVVLSSSYGEDAILTSMPVITGDDGVAVFQVEMPPVNGDVPLSVSYTATASPNSGTSTDPVQTVGSDPDNTTEWQDESPAFVKDFSWSLQNGFLTETDHGLSFDAHECIGHVDAFDMTIQRQDDNRFWDPGTKTWVTGQTWFPATAQPELDGSKPANTWNGAHSWDDLPQDMATRSNSEGFTVEWKVRATDGGNNEAIYSGGTQPVDYLVPLIVGGFVSRQGAGIGGDLPLAGEGFDIWSTAREYNPASGESWYRLEGGGAAGEPVAAPAAPISGSPDVTLEPVTLNEPVLGGDQKFGALGGRLVDLAGHDSGPVLDEAWAVFVKPLAPLGFHQDGAENPDADQVGCGATGLKTLLNRNPDDPAVARNSLQYAFLLDGDSSGDVSPGDYWLSMDGNGNLRWTDVSNGPTYKDAAGWGIGSGSWSDPLVLPVDDDGQTPNKVMDVAQDHQILVYAHNPMEAAEPAPGDDPNTVSDAVTVMTEGLPIIESFQAGDGSADLHECEPGGIHGTFSDDDGTVAEVQILIAGPNGEFFDGSTNQWVGTETWFTVSHDDATHTWSWDIPHELIANHVDDEIQISVRALDNDEGTCTACQGNVYSCNTPVVTVTLANDDPTIQIDPGQTDFKDGDVITGTLHDTEHGYCGNDGDFTAEISIRNDDTNEYWNGTAWQWGSVYLPVVVSWSDADGTWQYTLPAGFHTNYGGDHVFLDARITDDYGAQGAASDHSPRIFNGTPTANDDSRTTDEDTAVTADVLGNDADDSRTLVVSAVDTSGTTGQVTFTASDVTYNPDGQFESLAQGEQATDQFTYTAQDTWGLTDDAVVTITINGVNDPPTVVAPTADQTNNDSDTVSLDVSPAFSDVDNGAVLTYAASGLPSGLGIDPSSGMISGQITSSASQGGTGGVYTVTVTATDEHGASVSEIFYWTVNNPAPTATGIGDQTNDDSDGVNLDVSGHFSDPDGDTLTFSMTGQPGGLSINTSTGVIHGTISSSASTGSPYTVTVTATDADGASVSTTFTWTVNNPAPVAAADSYTTDEDTTLTVAAPGVLDNDTDPDGDPLTAVLDTDVSHGTLTLNGDGSFTYAPNTDYNGSDSFTYHVNDGMDDSNTVTVTITVNAVNDPPVATLDSYTTDEDTTLTVAAPGVLDNDTDVDGDTLTAVLDTDVSHGTLTLNGDGSFTYTPNTDYNGSDSFTYHANDGTADSNTVTVTITVNAVNDPPVATPDNYTTNEDTTLAVAAPGVLGNDTDVDGDTLTAVLETNVSHGTLTLSANGSFTYTPAANYYGSDSFTYHANDGTADSNTVTVTITVNAVNDPPVATPDNYTTNEDTTLTVAAPGVLGNDTDVDGDTLTAVLDTGVSHGTLTLNGDGSFTYTPNTNYYGSDSFTYHANDGMVDSNTVTVTITVNAPPTATPIPNQTDQDTESVNLNVSSYFSDPDGDTLTFSMTGQPSGLTIDATTGVISGIISSSASASSPYNVTVTADDGHGGTVSTTFTWTVTNPAPVVTVDQPNPFVLADGVTISGSASDDDSLSGVTLTIEDTTTGLFWDETTQTWSASVTQNAATGTTSWSLTLSAGFRTASNAGHAVSVVAYATDAQGAVGSAFGPIGTIQP